MQGWTGGSSRPRRLLTTGTAFLGVAVASGCYGYFPVEPAAAPPNDDVRVVLSDAASRRLSPTTRDANGTLAGDLVGLTDDSVSVSLWIGQAYRGTPFEPVHQTVTVPREIVVRFERRKLSRWRTALSAAGVVAFVAVMIDRIDLGPDPNPPGDGGPPIPPEGMIGH
ncbi:MAG TPA: hypothetical protein VE173_09580 [Longimicrobiales bacterium]|nr:hypothetical protein [Longimicrobiales bacterium]